MKKYLPFFASAFLLSAITPLHATFIVYGAINGVVDGESNPYGSLQTTVGMTVSGTFSYDLDLLSGGVVSRFDPNVSLSLFSSVGEGQALYQSIFIPGNPYLTVDANGLPIYGGIIGNPDLNINSSGIFLAYNPINSQPVGWHASVTYTITGYNAVPDAGATWFLLGLGLAGVAVARRCFRQTPV